MDALIEIATPWLIAYAGLTLFLWNIGRSKNPPVSLLETAQGAAAIILIFAFLTGGRGCTDTNWPEEDYYCGPGIYGC